MPAVYGGRSYVKKKRQSPVKDVRYIKRWGKRAGMVQDLSRNGSGMKVHPTIRQLVGKRRGSP